VIGLTSQRAPHCTGVLIGVADVAGACITIIISDNHRSEEIDEHKNKPFEDGIGEYGSR
jgi:hypothetical protein